MYPALPPAEDVVSPTDVLDLLTLQMTPGLGPHRIAALLERFGSAGAALRAPAAQLAEVAGIGAKTLAALREPQPRRDAEAEIERSGRIGVRLLALGGEGYPAWIKEMPGVPPILFVRGEIAAGDERAVALVGTRHPTASGKRLARHLAEGLVKAGVTVVSGLARGIDGIAHRAALEAGGRTLAVLAGGLGRIYPPEHAGLADDVAKAGALVTESATDQEPLKGLFPARNRIISALSRLVVIVQAGAESGALITAGHAAEQGRTVLAVPGATDDEQHEGCHRLIRQGAILCRHVTDVLEELDGAGAVPEAGPKREVPAATKGPPPGLDETQRRVWEFLDAPRGGDELARHLGVGVAQLSGVLLVLEMKRAIRRLPGNRYERG